MATDPDEIDEQAIREVVRDELAQQAGDGAGVQDSSNQQTSDSGGWSRRDTLLGALGLAGGAALPSALQSSVGTAQAQTAVGQVGTSSEPVDLYGAAVDVGSLTVGSSSALISVAESGQVTLSSGTATVDTGLSATDATFYLALGVDDPGADCELAGKLFWDTSVPSYKITIDEVDTSVGNPTVNYDVLRVR